MPWYVAISIMWTRTRLEPRLLSWAMHGANVGAALLLNFHCSEET